MAGPAEKLNTRLLMAAESFHQGASAAHSGMEGSGRWRPSRTAGERYEMPPSMNNTLCSPCLGVWALTATSGCGGGCGPRPAGGAPAAGALEVTLLASRVMHDGGTATCDELAQALKGATMMTYQSITCVGANSGCRCTFVLVDQTSTETGTYSTTPAGLLTETVMGGR